jgi:hypothetical protein
MSESESLVLFIFIVGAAVVSGVIGSGVVYIVAKTGGIIKRAVSVAKDKRE